MTRTLAFGLLAPAVVLLACNDDYAPDDDGFLTPDRAPGAAADWCRVQAQISRDCTVCHSAEDPNFGNLDLAHDAYAHLVGVSSPQYASRTYVVPSEPDQSFLWIKLLGTQEADEGARMPFGGAAWPQANLDLVRAWIEAGASEACAG